MGVITISRKMGSSGSYIGRQVAARLGMRYVDKHIISQIMMEYGFSQFDTIYDNVPGFWDKYDNMRRSTIEFLIRTIEAIGQLDNVVIVGRGGFGIFEGFSDVLNIRVKAPFCLRVERQMKEHSMSREEAEEHVSQNDRVRRSFIESDFHMEYTNTMDFDLVLDTGVVAPEAAVGWVCDAYEYLMRTGRCDSDKNVQSLEIDPVLHEHVMGMIDRVCAAAQAGE